MAVSVEQASTATRDSAHFTQAAIVQLDTVRGTRFELAATNAPWDLPTDALVLSVGPNGLGQLGMDFFGRFPSLPRPSLDAMGSTLSPTTPVVSEVNASAGESASSTPTASAANVSPDLRLRLLVYSTIREPGSPPDPSGSTPPTIQTIRTACVAAVAAAARAGARAVALPILGTGIGGQQLDVAAQAVLPALRAYADDLAMQSVEEIFLVAPDATRAQVIEHEWRNPARSLQLRMLADAPVDDEQSDLLGAASYAAALAFVVDHPETRTPLTIAINAPWGAGKTSLAQLVEKRVVRNRLRFQAPITCWFNAWHHDDAPSIVTALASTVARAAAAERSVWRRMFDPLPTRMLTPRGRRRRHLATTALAVGAGLIALVLSGAFHTLSVRSLTGSAVVALVTAGIREVTTLRGTASDVASLVRTPEAAFASGSLEEVRADLGRLIHQATRRSGSILPAGGADNHRRLIVFIDDLERCLPARSIEVCETVSGLLSHDDVVVVLIGDIQTLATAAEAKYHDLAPRYRTATLAGLGANAPAGSFGELYLEKIIQFRFDIPTHDLAVLKSLATKLLNARGPTTAAATTDSDDEATRRAPGESTDRAGPFGQLSTALRRWRAERHQRAQDKYVRSAVSAGEDPEEFEDTTESVEHRASAREMYRLQMLLQRLDGKELEESFRAVADLIRPLPRDLKRLLNRIRFLLYVANDRDLLAPNGPLTTAAIGKWALLAERWPDLAVAVSADPPLLGRLEVQSRTPDGYVAAMEEVVPGYSRSAELWRVLTAEPALGPNAACLSRFRAQGGS